MKFLFPIKVTTYNEADVFNNQDRYLQRISQLDAMNQPYKILKYKEAPFFAIIQVTI